MHGLGRMMQEQIFQTIGKNGYFFQLWSETHLELERIVGIVRNHKVRCVRELAMLGPEHIGKSICNTLASHYRPIPDLKKSGVFVPDYCEKQGASELLKGL